MIIKTCPKCGNQLLNIAYTTYPPIYAEHCNSCGYHWESKPEPFIEEVYDKYTDTAGNLHWIGTHSGKHIVRAVEGET